MQTGLGMLLECVRAAASARRYIAVFILALELLGRERRGDSAGLQKNGIAPTPPIFYAHLAQCQKLSVENAKFFHGASRCELQA
jgi:hypothetical protein